MINDGLDFKKKQKYQRQEWFLTQSGPAVSSLVLMTVGSFNAKIVILFPILPRWHHRNIFTQFITLSS